MTARQLTPCLAALLGLVLSGAGRGDDFNMAVKADDIKLGKPVMGPKVTADDLKGRVILLEFWGVN